MGIKEDVKASYSEGLKRRMRNWARSVSGIAGNLAQINWDFTAGRTDDGPPIPILQGDAHDVGKAFEALPARFRRAVELYWLWGDEDAELTVLGRKCEVDYRTYGQRVIDGHGLLKAELARAEAAWKEHRQRSEAAILRARSVDEVLT